MQENIQTWLTDIGLEHLRELFSEQEVDFDVLETLTEADLREMGIAALGARKRLLKAIGERNSSTHAQQTVVQLTQAPRAPPGAVRPDVAAVTSPASPTKPAAQIRERESIAERRHLTVMFCDMVDSTVLASTNDPEDFQELIQSYHQAVTRAVMPFEGYVAKFLGDGALVYFGYPHAYEDTATRCVRAAMAVIQSVGQLRQKNGNPLSTRIGVATGTVVFSDVGAGTAAAEKSAAGDTLNLAARLQNVAKPGQIVVAGRTRYLLESSFDVESLGKTDIKGFGYPIEVWLLRGERQVSSRFEARQSNALIPFVGRESEVSLLLERWQMASDGDGQIVLLSGEAGIGKSRVTYTLKERIAQDAPVIVQCQCSPYFSNSALYPVVKYLEQASVLLATDGPVTKKDKLEALLGPGLPVEVTQSLLRLMGLPHSEPLFQGLSPQQEKSQVLRAFADLVISFSKRRPVLFFLEDAHWIDPTTEEFLAQLTHRVKETSILAVVTCRPEYKPSWSNAASLTTLTLSRLGQRQCAVLVKATLGDKSLPDEVVAEIVRKTDGVPLFVEELTRTVMQSGILVETPEGYKLKAPMQALTIPSSLQDSLMARLDRLTPAKEVAQAGAAIGREFSYKLLAEVMSTDTSKLNAALDQLVGSGLVTRSQVLGDTLFTFKHALIQDTAYNSMLKAQRVLHHGRIAFAIEKLMPEVKDAQPELLAQHYMAGGESAKAFELWSMAGELAVSRSASREAASHYRAALSLLHDSAGFVDNIDRLRLAHLMKLANCLMVTVGFAAHESVEPFVEARRLALSLKEMDTYVAACQGLLIRHYVAGEFHVASEMFSKVDRNDLSLTSQVGLFNALGMAALMTGHFKDSITNLTQVKAEIQATSEIRKHLLGGVYPETQTAAYLYRAYAYSGYLDKAVGCVREISGRETDHEPSNVWNLQNKAAVAFLEGNFSLAIAIAKNGLERSQKFGLVTRIATNQAFMARAMALLGQVEEAVPLLKESLNTWKSAAGKFHTSEFAALSADALLNAGFHREAAEFIVEAEKVANETEEVFFKSEISRFKGRLAALAGRSEEANAHYRDAIDIAEQQCAKLFSLRAATDLAELCIANQDFSVGLSVLQPIYNWFSEGFGFPDLIRANIALTTLKTNALGASITTRNDDRNVL